MRPALLSLLLFCLSAGIVTGQSALKTFTSSDGLFRFKYSNILVDCTAKPKDWDELRPSVPEGCLSQQGMCGDAGGSREDTIACYAYPKGRFEHKPAFVAGAFFVAELPEAKSQSECLASSPYWNLESTSVTTINGIGFKVFNTDGVGLGSGQDDHLYRTFHHEKCYELGMQMAFSNPANYDPGTIDEFTKADSDEVERKLKQALNSFRFVN